MKRSTLFLTAMLAAAAPAAARITRMRSSPPSTSPTEATLSPWAPLAAFIVGSGIDYHTGTDQSELGFPMLLEWNLSERLTLILKPQYVVINSKSADVSSVSGFGDLETAVDVEILS